MEIVKDEALTIENLAQEMQDKIQDFYFSLGVDPADIKNESMQRWTACLMYLYNNIFKNNKHLYVQGNPSKDSIYSYINYYSNSYIFENLNIIADLYIYYTYLYSKRVSILGYSKLLNINPDYIYHWDMPDRSNPLKSQIYKKLLESDKQSLEDKLIFEKAGQLGIIAVLNHNFGYDMPAVRVQTQKTIAQSVADLPKLGANPSNCTMENAPENSKILENP